MAEKSTFPKVSLKYPSLEAFAKAARKCFEKGRLTVKLKRDFESGQRIQLVFMLGDRPKPVEIIGQINDRVIAKGGEGYNYGVRFLNFSEAKLNRLLAGEELKPAPPKEQEVKPEPAPETEAQAPAAESTTLPPEQEVPAAPEARPSPEPEPAAPTPEPEAAPEPAPPSEELSFASETPQQEQPAATPSEPEVSAPEPGPELEIQAPAPEPEPVAQETSQTQELSAPEPEPEPVFESQAPEPGPAPEIEQPAPEMEHPSEPAPEAVPEPIPEQQEQIPAQEPPEQIAPEPELQQSPEEAMPAAQSGSAIPEQPETELPSPETETAHPPTQPAAQAESEQEEEYGEFEYEEEEVTIQSGHTQSFNDRAGEAPQEYKPAPEFNPLAVEESIEAQPAQEPIELAPETAPEPSQEPTQEPVQEPRPEPSREPALESLEEPAPEPVQEPVQESSQEPAPEPIQETALEPPQEAEPEIAPPPQPELPPLQPETVAAETAPVEASAETSAPEQKEELPELVPGPLPETAFQAPAMVGREIVDIGKPAPEEKPEQVPAAPALAETAKPAQELKPISPKAFADFLFRFCKMVLNPPDIKLPDSIKNFASLFEEFQGIMESRDRIGIYLAITPSSKDFIIDGVQPLSKSIRVLLPPDLSGTLIFRMIEVFDQKELVGIIFRKFIDLERFQNFIINLGKFKPEKESGDALALRLIYLGVYHFNLIFETDLVPVPEKIEEETKIILARFSGELKRLNSLASQISEEPLALLTLRVEDIVKFVNNPMVIVQMLEHLSLVWANQVEDFEFQDFEDQVLFSIPISLLLGTFEIFAKRIRELEKKGTGKSKKKEAMRVRLEKLLKRVMARIAYEAPAQALEPLSQLFERKVIRYEELPLEIRDQVAASTMAKEFLKKPEPKLEEFEALRELKAYNETAGQLLWSAVALLEQNQINWAQRIFSKLVDHYQEKEPPFPERSKTAREILKKLAEPTAVEIVVRLLETGKKEEKELAAAMLYAAGPDAARRLMALLETSEDRNVRRMISEILARMGERISGLLLEEINKPDIPWYLARNMLMVLAETKSPIAQERAKLLLQHSHHRVREEALGYLFATGTGGIEQILMESLKDSALTVRTRALGCMAKLDAVSEAGLDRVYQLTRQLTGSAPNPESELCFQQAIELLDKAGSNRKYDGMEIDKFFMSFLEQSEKGLFSRAKLELSPKMKIPLVEALGRRKTEKAAKIISKLAKDKDEPLKKAAQKALEQIEQ